MRVRPPIWERLKVSAGVKEKAEEEEVIEHRNIKDRIGKAFYIIFAVAGV